MDKKLVIGSSNTDLFAIREHFPVAGEAIEGLTFQQNKKSLKFATAAAICVTRMGAHGGIPKNSREKHGGTNYFIGIMLLGLF